jgi:hypothetical protein
MQEARIGKLTWEMQKARTRKLLLGKKMQEARIGKLTWEKVQDARIRKLILGKCRKIQKAYFGNEEG